MSRALDQQFNPFFKFQSFVPSDTCDRKSCLKVKMKYKIISGIIAEV